MKKRGKTGERDGVKSPCTRKCSLGIDKVCPACHRTIDEIVAWHDADDLVRRSILEAVKLRRARLG